MHYSYLIPEWFFGFDIGMEILFAIVTFLLAFFSFRIYNISKERNVGLFGIAFMLISFSYIVWASLNMWAMNVASRGLMGTTVKEVFTIEILGVYLYMVFFISGLVTLTYMTSGSKSGKPFYLFLGLSLLIIALSFHKLVSFRILSIFLLSFISYHYLEGYIKNKNKKTLGVFAAFGLLFLSSVDFIFSLRFYQAYVIGHILEFIAYWVILVILIKSVKR